MQEHGKSALVIPKIGHVTRGLGWWRCCVLSHHNDYSLPFLLENFPVTINHMATLDLDCNFPLLSPSSPSVSSKKALRKRGNCSNSKTPDSWIYREVCLGLGKSALDSMQTEPLGALQRDPRDLLGVIRAMNRPVGMET